MDLTGPWPNSTKNTRTDFAESQGCESCPRTQANRFLGVCLVSIPKRHPADRPDSSRLYGLRRKSIEIGDLETNSKSIKRLRTTMDSNLALEANPTALGVCLVSIPRRHQADEPDPSRLYGLRRKSIEIGDLVTNSKSIKRLRQRVDSNLPLSAMRSVAQSICRPVLGPRAIGCVIHVGLPWREDPLATCVTAPRNGFWRQNSIGRLLRRPLLIR
jgi:hypothetical protein